MQFWELAAIWPTLDGGEYLRLVGRIGSIWIQATYNPILDTNGKVCKISSSSLPTCRSAAHGARPARRQRARPRPRCRPRHLLAKYEPRNCTPMNAIIGFTEALLTPCKPEQRHQLTTVHHAARSMLRLLNDVPDTAKAGIAGAVTLEVYDFSLRRCATRSWPRCSSAEETLPLRLDSWPERSSDLRRRPAPAAGCRNLLGNGSKFTDAALLLRLDYHDGTLVIEVEDTGIGIAAQHLERIFDPLHRPMRPPRGSSGGTGLGTTISRQLVELMGGSISVRSTAGRGHHVHGLSAAARGPGPGCRGHHGPGLAAAADAHAGGGRCASQHRAAADPPGPGAPPGHRGTGRRKRCRRLRGRAL